MSPAIPSFALYGEQTVFPDILHVESIADRAAGLNWTIAPHRHAQLHQMLYLQGGAATVTLDGAAQSLGPPCVVNLPPGTVHSFRFAAGAAGHVLTLPLPEWAEAPPPAAACVIAADADLAGAVAAVVAAHRQAGQSRRLAIRAAVYGLLVQLAGRLAPEATAGRPATDARVAALHDLAAASPRIGLTVEDCARHLGLSPRHLSRLCLDATGQTPQAVIHAAVLREACRLLAYTQLNVASIGHRLGFDDPSYFNRFFRRQTGLSPGVYRRRMGA